MSEQGFDAAAVTQRHTEATERLAREIDSTVYQAEVDGLMEPFTSETGMWRFASDREKEKAVAAIQKDLDDRAGLALYTTTRQVLDDEPLVRASVERTKDVPAPIEAWQRRVGKSSYNLTEEWQSETLAELRAARLDRQLAEALPSQVLSEYQRAVERQDTDTLRWIEARHTSGWTGRQTPNDTEASLVLKLARTIKRAREARVPADLLEALSAIAQAKKVIQAASNLPSRRILPRRPKGEQ